jgi:hypothetical protein
MKRSILLCVILLIIPLFNVTLAARLLPRFKSSKGIKQGSVSSGVIISPKLRGDRLALNIYFGNLQKVSSVFYTLIYQTNGKDEGISGEVNSSGGNSTNRELLFGTCSSGVCRYHENISNMRFEVQTELPSGKKTLRRYKIKV